MKYSTNAPFYDDFYWGFSFLEKYLNSDSLIERYKIIFSQHSQHRLAYLRIFILTYYHLFGTINFKHIAIWGNISNLIIFFLLFHSLKKDTKRLIFILPIALILFQFQYYYNIITTYSLPNQGVCLWSILSFYCLSLNTRKTLYYSLLFAGISVFSNGNGIITFPVLLFFLFLQHRFDDLKITSALFCLTLIVYFTNYVSHSSEITLSFESVIYYFKFLSAAFTTFHHPFEAFIALFIFILFLTIFSIDCYAIYLKKSSINHLNVWIFTSATIVWIFSTAAAVTLYRVIHHVAVVNWYMTYSVLFMVFSIYFFILYVKNIYAKCFIFLLLVGYGTYNYLSSIRENAPFIQLFQSGLEADVINYKKNNYWSFLVPEIGSVAYEKLNKSSQLLSKKKIYIAPKVHKQLLGRPHPKNTHQAKFTFQKHEYDHIIATLVMPDSLKKKKNIKKRFGLVMSKEDIYFFGVLNPLLRSKREMVKTLRVFDEAPHFNIAPKYFQSSIKKGEYQLGMVFVDHNDNVNWFISDQKVNLENY